MLPGDAQDARTGWCAAIRVSLKSSAIPTNVSVGSSRRWRRWGHSPLGAVVEWAYCPAMHDLLIVGYDGSASSATALEWAADEATRRAASLRIVSSYALPAKRSFGVYTKDETEEELQRQSDDCRTRVTAVMAVVQHRHAGLGLDERIVEQPAAEALVEESGGADLVIVGAGRAGIVERLLLGSVTAAVLHHSRCPVVVVPAALHDRTGRVVVGIDGSAHSADAVRWACDEGDRLVDELLVVHAWEYP